MTRLTMTALTEANPEPPPTTEVAETLSEDEGLPGFLRQSAEFVVVLSISVLLFRTFAAEAYIVPTGSMATTLLGDHREITCGNCEYPIVLGLDERGRAGRPVCPNCGQTDLENAQAVESHGDRVLVQKFLYDFRPPERWEVAVFQFPGDPSQAYVKRVVGLPGESIRIALGDVWINGKVARKSLAEQRAMRIPIHDHQFLPRDSDRVPRWVFRRGRFGERLPTGWRTEGTRFVHGPVEPPLDRYDWVDYRHWDPNRGRYAPVHDFIAYNGSDTRGENLVPDLMIATEVQFGPDARAVAIRLEAGSDRFLVELPIGPEELPVVRRNGRTQPLAHSRAGLTRPEVPWLLEVSAMDRRLTVAVNGRLLFDPIDYEDPRVGPGPSDSPLAIGVQGGAVTLDQVRVYRDVYYTASLAFSPRRASGVVAPYKLGPDEFFVLGDNSPVSNDSRFWSGDPVVPADYFLGKPFLVHLPGQVIPLKVFGRSLYWVPDPREIRYIR